MDLDEVEMLRHTLSPEEFPAAVMIAEYLAERSQAFKELTDLRLKVCRSEKFQDVYLDPLRVGVPARAISFLKPVARSPTAPIRQRDESIATFR